jgi:hypothetical protein
MRFDCPNYPDHNTAYMPYIIKMVYHMLCKAYVFFAIGIYFAVCENVSKFLP